MSVDYNILPPVLASTASVFLVSEVSAPNACVWFTSRVPGASTCFFSSAGENLPVAVAESLTFWFVYNATEVKLLASIVRHRRGRCMS